MYIKSHKSAFISLFVVLLTVTVASVVYNAYWRTSDALLDLAEQIIEEASTKIIDRIDSIFNAADQYLYINKYLVAQRDIIQDQDELLALFWQQIRLTPEIVSIYTGDVEGNFVQARELPRLSTRVIDRRGGKPLEQIVYRDQNYRPIAHIEEDALYDPRERPWYLNTGVEQKVYMTDPYRFSICKPGVTGTIPIINELGEIDTILGVDITLDSVSAFLAKQRIAGAGYALIVDEMDRLIAFPFQLMLRGPDNGTVSKCVPSIQDLADQWLLDAYQACKVEGAESSQAPKPGMVTSQTDGQRYVAQLRDFPKDSPIQYRLFTVVPESTLLSSAQRIRSESFVVSIMILILAIIVVYALAHHFSNPIKKLAENTALIKQLRLDEVSPVKSEFREIQAMNASMRDLKQGLEALQKYIPPEQLSTIIQSGKDVRLGGQTVNLTIVFSKMSGFSNLSSQLPVDEVTEILTNHLDALSDIIEREMGTIDNYMGDRFMAFWGGALTLADGPERACRTALLCQRAGREIDRKLTAADKPAAANVFGIHSGEAIVGNIGSSTRMSYTALGINVETARMLRNLNYLYGTSILISDSTYQHIEALFSCRRLDVVRLREDSEPMTLYELLAKRDTLLATETIDFNKRYDEAFLQYQQGAWDEAFAAFRALGKERPDDKAVRLMFSRLEKTKPVRGKGRQSPEDWDGAVTLSHLSGPQFG